MDVEDFICGSVLLGIVTFCLAILAGIVGIVVALWKYILF
jgi:hypothetical protein